MANESEAKALDFDGEFEATQDEFETVSAGEYAFDVVGVEREQFNGSGKIPPCPVAKVKIRLHGEGVEGRVLFDRMKLVSNLQWIITKFFVSVGLHDADAPKGTKLKMEWQRAIGLSGRVKVGVREYNGKEYNEVKEWLRPQPTQAPAAPAAVQAAVKQTFDAAKGF